MNTHVKKACIVAALIAGAFVLSACGSDPTEPVSQTNTGQTSDPDTKQGFAGTITNDQGDPIPGCFINKGGGTEEGIITAADGTYSAHQEVGTWKVEAGCWPDGDQTKDPVVVKKTVKVAKDEVTTVDFQVG